MHAELSRNQLSELTLDLLQNPEFFTDEDPQLVNMIPAVIFLFPDAQITSENTMKINFLKRFMLLYEAHRWACENYIRSNNWNEYLECLRCNLENVAELMEEIPDRSFMKVGNLYREVPLSRWTDADGDTYATYRSIDGEYKGQFKVDHFRLLV